ncbi:carboxymuconolactone decarboxylase family protein [Mycobacteroides sp. LB1]|uniref:carboxymuconolactone decarboxylase family protein n=1 Tax=Mycobacteroides sp. LB1 TaxID=2750814 RepID=UPI0015DE2438|nr:carboxymuconolactone decarboxylase family protein [Mycobacteroides sp. LB1]
MTGRRVYIDKQTPSVYQALTKTAAELRARAAEAGLSRITLELVNIRVSQLNRCLFCLDLHTRVALEEGESTQRIAVLPVWEEAELFSDVERAALRIAEAVTEVTVEHLTDEQYTAAREHLSDDQVSVLVWSAVMINTFNRISILSRHPIKKR